MFTQRDAATVDPIRSPIAPLTVAIFGASGTAGDGVLKASLASPMIGKIYVITRRITSRMEEGLSSGKLELMQHRDYLDYSALIEKINNVDAVYWAIGISSLGADEKTYGMIHVDFPTQFLTELIRVSTNPDTSFHFISSSDISEQSSTMWVREKIRAEKTLFSLAQNSNLRVLAYRPDYIGPTIDEAHLGQHLLYWFFKPVGAAVRATQIGQAMIDVTLRGSEFENGSKLSTGKIIAHSKAYEKTGSKFNSK